MQKRDKAGESMTKLDQLRELAASDEGKDLMSLKMLLRVCDAYADQYVLARNHDPECGCMLCMRCKQEAEVKLEELIAGVKIGNSELSPNQKTNIVQDSGHQTGGPIAESIEEIVCESCGKAVNEIKGKSRKDGDILIGEIRLDPGCPANRVEPEIAAEYYFWCAECAKTEAESTEKHALTAEQRTAIEYAISSLEQCGSELEDQIAAKILQAMLTEAVRP
jgi:hypothetical protein